MNLNAVITIDDLRKCAKRRLPRFAYDFIESGVEDEKCLSRNEGAFANYRLLPHYFVDGAERRQTVALFGKTYGSPFGICPTGMASLWRPGADGMLAKAAAAANIPFILSCSSNISIEAAIRCAPGNIWFQLYSPKDRTIGERMVRTAMDAGVETLVITADVAVAPNRERNMRNGFAWPPRLKPSTILDVCRHPAWLTDYVRAGGLPMLAHWAPFAKPDATAAAVAQLFADQTPGMNQTWDMLAFYRKLWPGRLVVKGLLHPGDAVRAVGLGVDGIIVSNHGGRQFDAGPSPIEALPSVLAAVDGRAAVMVDSGVRRGTDILTALCLGADFVFVGRATLYGVAAFGLPGAQKAIEILKREIDVNMAQMGCTDLAMLDRDALMDGPHRSGWAGAPPPSSRSAPRPQELPLVAQRERTSSG